MSYINNDGLRVPLGLDAGKKGSVGALRFDGQRECIEIDISWDRLPSFVTTINTEYTVASEYVKLPIGALIEAAELVVTVLYDDAAGGPAVLNVGTVDDDGTSNADADSLIAAASLAELVVGTKLTGTSPVDGALLVSAPAVLTVAKKIIWAVTGTDYASGKGNVRIFYSIADKATDELGT